MALRGSAEFSNEYSPVRDIVSPWLENPNWKPSELWEFLRGGGLPNMGTDRDPWNLLWIGVLDREKNMDPEAQVVMAGRVAHLLQTKPDVTWPRYQPIESLSGLFNLANALEAPHQLADPLHDVYQRILEGSSQLSEQCQASFTLAVIRNQADTRYHQPLVDIAQGNSAAGLYTPGGVLTGVEGLIRMPASRDQISQPFIGAIEEAFGYLAAYLDTGKDPTVRDGAFSKDDAFSTGARDLLTAAYPSYPAWGERVREMWMRAKVPEWAVNALKTSFATRH